MKIKFLYFGYIYIFGIVKSITKIKKKINIEKNFVLILINKHI